MPTETLTTTLEELALNAWPPVKMLHCDGWILGFSSGFTRRANSIQPLYAAHSDMLLDEKITLCESIYARHIQPPIFKLTAASHPADLDQALAQRGYSKSALTSVKTLDLNQVALPELTYPSELTEALDERWLEEYCQFNEQGDFLPVVWQILTRIAAVRVFARIYKANTTVAVGMGVMERGWIGLFGLVVEESWRGQGIGKQLVGSLLDWGRMHGAQNAYLQVMRDNQPALRLYDDFGFQESYTYWYRAKPDMLLNA